jgi:hypothetical protein
MSSFTRCGAFAMRSEKGNAWAKRLCGEQEHDRPEPLARLDVSFT